MAKRDPLYPDVAVYGAPGAGKTTAAEFMVKLGFTPVSVAGYHRGGVRDVALRIWGTGADLDRAKLNALAMLREHDPDVWMRNWQAEVERQHRTGNALVADDFRGENEWQLGHAQGFVFVHLVADDDVREQRLAANNRLDGTKWDFHYVLEDTNRYTPDHVIVNNGTEQELHEAIVDILNLERRRRA